jgi:hypothetical protein
MAEYGKNKPPRARARRRIIEAPETLDGDAATAFLRPLSAARGGDHGSKIHSPRDADQKTGGAPLRSERRSELLGTDAGMRAGSAKL